MRGDAPDLPPKANGGGHPGMLGDLAGWRHCGGALQSQLPQAAVFQTLRQSGVTDPSSSQCDYDCPGCDKNSVKGPGSWGGDHACHHWLGGTREQKRPGHTIPEDAVPNVCSLSLSLSQSHARLPPASKDNFGTCSGTPLTSREGR
jgi:hypothetical protein